ncbi:hypothetical protein Jden_1669 [Jonesia denitrificans DSM 20603]|uniref:Uncharacterized protein n=1 Tax=Jonesia denitrificans (strain ATCC 14870 / DSM 20603 / BCRC 15368 / CIP 55.134 / JCM 11481 / NBRC 15587 / NCTC 10816 / Prevot 55134) TaxID=471856 RepID=C7QYS7_JONDD|nr:hypothetical protein Jden_1669 [Jonesia denitrificans DSM 20603]
MVGITGTVTREGLGVGALWRRINRWRAAVAR